MIAEIFVYFLRQNLQLNSVGSWAHMFARLKRFEEVALFEPPRRPSIQGLGRHIGIWLAQHSLHINSLSVSEEQYIAVQCSAVQCSSVLYSAVQCSAMQCSAVWQWQGPLCHTVTASLSHSVQAREDIINPYCHYWPIIYLWRGYNSGENANKTERKFQ